MFKYDGLEFVLQWEVALPDTPSSLQMVGGTVFAAIKRYGRLSIGFSLYFDILPSISLTMCIPWHFA